MDRRRYAVLMSIIFALCFVAISTGCATYFKSVYDMPAPERDKIISRTYANPPSDVYDVYLNYFQTNGWSIETPNKESGIITTGWKDINELGGKGFKGTLLTAMAKSRTRRKFTISAVALDGGQTKLSITMIQERADEDKENWKQQIMNEKYLTSQLGEIFSAVKASLEEVSQ